MNEHTLEKTAKQLVNAGKGILAADESTPSIAKRFKSVGVENTEEHRRSYREMLFTTAGMENYISGVIMYDETIRQKTKAGKPFTELLKEKNVVPGIKVDTGAKALAGSPDEKITEGLDGLRERLKEYYELGARFAKWRAVITISEKIPTDYCIHANAEALARYAALCQEMQLVPIVEPEVLMDGDHTIERCYEVTEKTLHTVFNALNQHRVAYNCMLLKPNMVISGTECSRQASVDEVALQTLRCLYNNVPAAVPGIVFLSGGQSDEKASAHLNAMNSARQSQPWKLSFSYGRALQAPALKAWAKNISNYSHGQQAFHHRARLNCAASEGRYSSAMEKEL